MQPPDPPPSQPPGAPEAPEAGDPRVYFAAERTLLAWVRTGLAMMGFGFVVARFGLFLREVALARAAAPPSRLPLSLWAGTALVLLGVMVSVLAAIRHVRFKRRFDRGEPGLTPRATAAVVVALCLAAVGAVIAAYLLSLAQ